MAIELKPAITFTKFLWQHLRVNDEPMQKFADQIKHLTDADKRELAQQGCREFGYAGITFGSDVASESVVVS